MRSQVLVLVLAVFSFSAAACCSMTLTPQPTGTNLYERIAVIGASGSAGFGIPVDLAEALDEAITIAHDEPADLASEMTFMDPMQIGKRMVDRAIAHDSTIVFAFDFPFWFGYGINVESERMSRLEQGLAMLDRIRAPIVVSGFPDMHLAIGPLFSKEFVPEVETIHELDARVREWAEARERVTFYDLGGTIARIERGEVLPWDGEPWPREGATPFQADRLHPTEEGLVMIALYLLNHVEQSDLGVRVGAFDRDPVKLLQALERRGDAKQR
ncbi:MAG: SGNH/GDSL hydrolase family protein [Actinomycetota bacterium]|jgi:hypothetical protein|nr:SGNH/GDSL hydrolase family protein [Actinomycetota bacterium]